MSIDGVAGTSVGCGAPEIVTGSHDGENIICLKNSNKISIITTMDITGYVKVWDPRQKGTPVAIMESTDDASRHCWAVAFGVL